jgi:ComF family protein
VCERYRVLKALGRYLLDAVAPRRCAGCGEVSDEPVCDGCDRVLDAFPVPAPRRLASLTSYAAYEFDGIVREILHRGKFQGDRAALRALAERASDRSDGAPPADAVVAVPLGMRRRRARGYNQAEVIASVLGARHGAPLVEGLVRIRETMPQASRDEAARRANIAGAFEWRGIALDGAVLWLVDDVLTTGATAEAAAAVLRAAGAEDVAAVVVATVR